MDYRFPKLLKGPDGFRARVISFGPDLNANSKRHTLSLKDADGNTYCIDIPDKDLATALLNKIVLFFRHSPEWRNYFMRPAPTPVWRRGDDQALSDYDPQIAPYLHELESRGYTVVSYNKGDDHPCGSPCVLKVRGQLPDTLRQVARANGWLTADESFRLVTSMGSNHLARPSFLLMLDDWVSDDLDVSGLRYQVGRADRPLFPEWPNYPTSALIEQENLNRKKAERINHYQTPTTFSDYTQLTSGRDTYSTMSMEALCEALADDPVLERLNEIADNPIILAKALRWRLRGLSVMHTIEKYRVDDILHNHAERQRETRRKEWQGRKSTCDDAKFES